VVLVLLIVFFALGIGGEQAIRGLSQRVNKIAAFGTEVSFSDAAGKNAHLRVEGSTTTVAKVPDAAGSSLGSDSSFGTQVLSSFGDMIGRDIKYMQLIAF
jgi:hypothetical protein